MRATCPAHLMLLDLIILIFLFKFSRTSYHFILFGSKYSPQHPDPKHRQSVFFPQYQRPRVTPIRTYRQVCTLHKFDCDIY
jgi:hypothetical protein